MTRGQSTTLVLSTALLSAVALSAFDKSLDAQDKKAVSEKQAATTGAANPFAGKVLLVQKKNDSSPAIFRSPQIDMGVCGFVLDNPIVKEVGGIRMLTGHGIERVDGKPAGPRVSLPMETIGAILEFDNVEAYKHFEEQQTEQMQNAIEMLMPTPVGPGAAPAEVPDA